MRLRCSGNTLRGLVPACVQKSLAVWTVFIISATILVGSSHFAHGQVSADEDGPQVAPPISDETLPSPAVAPPDLDVIQFAGGAIEIQVPAGWQTLEVPAGRELRIWLTEGRPAEGQRPQNGVWISFHWRGRAVEPRELRDWLDFRIEQLVARRGDLGDSEHRQLGAFPALVRETEEAGRRNWVLLAATNTGIFELVATAELRDFPRHRAAAESVLASIKLASPQIGRASVRADLRAATPVVGLWKSLQAKLWFGGDGRVVVDFDRRKNFWLDEAGNVDYGRKVTKLTGQYEAREDIVFIRWDDGSRLNYRWQVDDGQLLLTDHNGRVSQLDRLID